MLRIMFLTKLKTAGAALLAVSIIATGVGVPAQQAVDDPAGSPKHDQGPAPISTRPRESPAPPGRISRVAARVGDEVITYHELTAAVKEKIAQMPGDSKPSRRDIMRITSRVLDDLIERIISSSPRRRSGR
jgi:hypothetical protein